MSADIAQIDNTAVDAILLSVATALKSMNGNMAHLSGTMLSLADTVRTMSERISQLEREVAQLTPVTAAQAKALGTAVRSRAAEIAAQYTLSPASTRAIGASIRKSVKLDAGVGGLEELPRMLYGVYIDYIGMWDDFEAMKPIRTKYAVGRESYNAAIQRQSSSVKSK